MFSRLLASAAIALSLTLASPAADASQSGDERAQGSGRPSARGAPSPAARRTVFPRADWERVPSPEAAGFSSERLADLRHKVERLQTTAMVVISGGRVVFEYGDLSDVSYVASVRKSILAMLFGKYVENGKVRLDKTLAELKVTDHGGLSESELQATVRDLMTARSGVYHAASNDGDYLADAPPRGSKKHGTYFLYSNWDFNALGTIFEQETGRSIYDALESDLARPLQMEDFDRARQEKSGDATQSRHLAYHMFLSTRDMARIGYLMLREGRWADRQVVPKTWVKRMVTPVTRNTEMNPASLRGGAFGYGLLWWVFDGESASGPYAGAYSGLGARGQFITVLPALDLVVAHKVKVAPGIQGVSIARYLALIDDLVAARRPPDPGRVRVQPGETPPRETPRRAGLQPRGAEIVSRSDLALAGRLDALVVARRPEFGGLAMAVVAGGRTVFAKAYGDGRLNEAYEYASVSKPITATIVLQLRRDGWIKSLDDDVRMYLPRYANAMPRPYEAAHLTLRHLLTHRGGVPHNDKPLFVGDAFNLQFEPGTRMLYSTPGYGLLGEAIRSVTGLSYSDAVKKYIGAPVGAASFRADDSYIAPGAFVRSTVQDMARFATGVMENRYVSADVLYGEALRPEEGGYALGWQVEGLGTDGLTAAHAGSNGLPRAHLLIQPRRKLAVAILAQARPGRALDLGALASEVLAELKR